MQPRILIMSLEDPPEFKGLLEITELSRTKHSDDSLGPLSHPVTVRGGVHSGDAGAISKVFTVLGSLADPLILGEAFKHDILDVVQESFGDHKRKQTGGAREFRQW